ncbi:hypothetical protein, partial [Candidatus Contendibacter odensensis]|uniref:hypothetical protein n=1 Tax=Candidatus Contendibacter odensensis TaxID=1400860 RepID=UPI001E4CB539
TWTFSPLLQPTGFQPVVVEFRRSSKSTQTCMCNLRRMRCTKGSAAQSRWSPLIHLAIASTV